MRTATVAVAMATCMVGIWPAIAKTNPDFTPVDLVKQSTTLLKVKLSPGEKPNSIIVETIESYKPADGPKLKITIDLSECPHKSKAAKIARMVKSGEAPFALFFAGKFVQQGLGPRQQLAPAYLHIGQCFWLSLASTNDPAVMAMEDIDLILESTWCGANDMLDRCVRYILAAKGEAFVASVADVGWDGEGEKVCGVPGKVAGAVVVALNDRRDAAFIMSDAGDALLVYDAKVKTLKNVATDRKLTSKSRVAAWGDFDRDGRVDLASWDGRAISLHLQQADGTFAAQPIDTGDALAKGCISLAVIDADDKGAVGLVAGTSAGPVLLTPNDKGRMAGRLLTPPTTQPEDISAHTGQCLVADFDDDGRPDIVQLFNYCGTFQRGDVQLANYCGGFYRGVGPGRFEAGKASPVCFGGGRGKGFLGDFDHDGLPDVLTVSEDGCRVWQNRGGARFKEVVSESGHIHFISKPDAIDGQTCDFNNDGRPDVLIVYSNMHAQIFFNRGWRNLTHANHPIDLGEGNLVPDAAEGQQAGCIGDFNGDGGQDMIVVCPNGDVYVLCMLVEKHMPPRVRVMISPKSSLAGPINVSARGRHLSCGACPLTPGATSAWFGGRGEKELTLQWKTPDGKLHTRAVDVAKSPCVQLDVD